MAITVMVPAVPTSAMCEAARGQSDPAAIWMMMVAAAPRSAPADDMPPPAVLDAGIVNRNPKFWGDRDVREMAIALHRQVTVAEALQLIADKVGPDRTPSKSALHRAWKRMDTVARRRGR
jgi:hypothetical protein